MAIICVSVAFLVKKEFLAMRKKFLDFKSEGGYNNSIV
jgi:hypothetical protein